jgi:hypothetical protein
LKKASNIFTVVLLSLSIFIGYTGVPVYKMMCTEDGHVNVSLSRDDAKCNHETETKNCCKPLSAQKHNDQQTSCCDFNNTFLKLQESSLVYTPQNCTGHILYAALLLFDSLKTTAPSNLACSSVKESPPLLWRKQQQQSITQIFRI